jgi:hypothetical protein
MFSHEDYPLEAVECSMLAICFLEKLFDNADEKLNKGFYFILFKTDSS